MNCPEQRKPWRQPRPLRQPLNRRKLKQGKLMRMPLTGMMVTAVIPVDKRKSKVFLEEGFAFVLYRGEVERYRIEEGRELEDEVYEEILRDVLRPRSKEYALHLLKDSGKTEKWMKEKLGKAGYPREAVEYAVNFLKEYRFLDDNAYAQSYVRSYAGKKSRRQMVYEMQQKGVDSSYIEEALDQSPVDEEESARQALTRRLKGNRKLLPGKRPSGGLFREERILL